MDSKEVRRQLGNMPTGPNKLSAYEFRITTPWDWTVSKLMTFGCDTMAYQIAESRSDRINSVSFPSSP